MANVNIVGLPVNVLPDGSEWVPAQRVGETAQRLTTAQIGDLAFRRLFPAAMEFEIDGGGGNITAKTWGVLTVPFNATISGARMFADQSGTMTIDIWKCTYDQYNAPTLPTSSNSICGGQLPAITASTKGSVTALQFQSWDTQLLARDVLTFNVPTTATGITRVTLALDLTRNSAS